MARRVFFSFHYKDVAGFRANAVRNSWLTKPDRQEAGFFDASLWEDAKRTSPLVVKRLINSALEGTTVTCVLIGSETYARPWVRYEILNSFRRGNSLLAVHINSIKGKDQFTKPKGPNPLAYVGVTYSELGDTATLWQYLDDDWKEYSEIDGSASYSTAAVAQQYRSQGCRLDRLYPTYDWVANDGYANFSSWVG